MDRAEVKYYSLDGGCVAHSCIKGAVSVDPVEFAEARYS